MKNGAWIVKIGHVNDKRIVKMQNDMIPEPCELNCIMQLIDPICQKCDEWYQYWADVDSSDEPPLDLSPEMQAWLEEADANCPDPDCICKKENNGTN